MKNIRNTLLLSFLLIAAVCFQANAADKELVVMTYNIRAGSMTTVDSLAEFISIHHPDFVALQEVDVMTKRANAKKMNGINIVSALAERTNMFGYFGKALNFTGGYYGIAILSRYPCSKMECFQLPNPKQTEQRVLLLGTFEIEGGRKMAFACTHLDVKSAETRGLQADFIIDKIKGLSMPTIIGGDFNACPDDLCSRKFHAAMTDISGSEPTFPSWNPDRKIDYLFICAPSHSFKPHFSTTTLPDKLSDHRAIVTRLSDCFQP
ncbi:MAG: endonuclease/exonuclease/phosphatase family protein [Bacteroidales bacterium]|nr:endonuclease/exonuclease/phosphatase family protein [Bacteroidales bacterium]MDY3912035.1 endonuclease/exonuclease/phosphatase family protein [Sodaliphilus sp.]